MTIPERIVRYARKGNIGFAISKTHDAPAILPLLHEGQRVFGENKVQEAAEKWPTLREEFPDVALHLVGQLQSNKAEDAVRLFDCVHSLDRLSLVAALARAMDKAGRRIPCFVQVNIGNEPQKGGCAIADLPALLAEARSAIGDVGTVRADAAHESRTAAIDQRVHDLEGRDLAAQPVGADRCFVAGLPRAGDRRQQTPACRRRRRRD